MKEVPYRLIRNSPAEFEKLLSREGVVLVSKNSKPFAIALDAASESLESAVRLLTQVRAQLAVSGMRAVARERRLDRLTSVEIQAEIDAVRLRRRR
ncbi:MAG: hypothetical protein ACRDHG_12385 [Anaerolineales bacterium]